MLQGSGEKALTVDYGVTIKAEANQYCISVTGAADQKVNQATVIIALNNPAADAYTVTCKPGQNVTVFELEAKPTEWTGSIQTLTEYEMTVPGENG